MKKFSGDRRCLLLGVALGIPGAAVATHPLLGNAIGLNAFVLPFQDDGDLGESVSVFAFMAPEQIADAVSGAARMDVTAACQAALDSGSNVYFPDGVYLLDSDPDRCLRAASNQKITLGKNATLRAKRSGLGLYSVFRIEDRENVTLEGGTIVGDRLIHAGTAGEHGMGIAIYNSSNVIIRGVTCRDCWGDGIYIGGKGLGGKSVNVEVEDCVCLNNRRQGLSITAADGCRVVGGRFSGTNGIAPSAGIDVEPNYSVIGDSVAVKAPVTNVLIERVECSDNEGPGISVSQVPTSNVRIVSAVIHRNGMSGIVCSHVGKDVQIIAPDSRDNRAHGISVLGSRSHIMKNVRIRDPACVGNRLNGVSIGRNVDGFSVVGGTISHNGQHGILCDGTGGSVCDNGLIQGAFVHSNSQNYNASFDNIHIGALCHYLRIVENSCKSGVERNKPAFGIRVTSNEVGLIVRNDLRSGGILGNASGKARKVTWLDNKGYEEQAALSRERYSGAA